MLCFDEEFSYQKWCVECDNNTEHVRGVCRVCVNKEKAVQIELFKENIREAEGLGDPEE